MGSVPEHLSSNDGVSVLFVCLGNICRSPMAEAVFRHHISSLPSSSLKFKTVDSAGTGAYHIHSPPDPRTMSALQKHSITRYKHSARQVNMTDFREFHYILAMDDSNLYDLLELREKVVRDNGKEGGADSLAVVRLLGDFQRDGSVDEKVGGGVSVPDPYYGGHDGFEEVYQQVVGHAEGFLKYLERKLEAD
ncbi:Low molecular weight phosphotyrosine protein phosphatase [Emydomyces testavorans]|uniref:Low molecular weight phosphotyrosine protein phosphatase n=1 Tax=Emydomyces testavorans TaxID=2070801 RepID=A0AAF0DK82_9EURO|nr:Low molecular weight phosphotyrosine protein phosphatase [Emydomyces testavorans]